jgi:hypothetical protein
MKMHQYRSTYLPQYQLLPAIMRQWGKIGNRRLGGDTGRT